MNNSTDKAMEGCVTYAFHPYHSPAMTPPVPPFVRPVPKIGRNDPCPCGSGKKNKKCCGENWIGKHKGETK